MSLAKAGAATAALLLMVQPCLAAQNNFAAPETRTAAFAGLQLRLPLGQKERAKPVARLQLSSAYYAHTRSGAFVQTHRPSGVELGAGKAGKPALYIGGQGTAEIEKKLNVGGSSSTLLIVGGVLLVVLVLAAVASAQPTPGPREGDFGR